MAAVAIAAKTDNFGINFGAARTRVLILFQHQHPRAFANHQAITPDIIRAGRLLGGIVFKAGGIQRVEYIGFRRTQFFAATGQHQINFAEFNRLIGIADALAA